MQQQHIFVTSLEELRDAEQGSTVFPLKVAFDMLDQMPEGVFIQAGGRRGQITAREGRSIAIKYADPRRKKLGPSVTLTRPRSITVLLIPEPRG